MAILKALMSSGLFAQDLHYWNRPQLEELLLTWCSVVEVTTSNDDHAVAT